MGKQYIYVKSLDDGLSTSDYLAIFALIISIVSLILTFYSTFLGKQVEIKILQFNKLCLEPIESYLESIKQKLDEVHFIDSATQNYIVNQITELNTYLVSLAKLYPNIKAITFDTFTDNFSDSIYSASNLETTRIEFYALRQILISSLLDFAIYQELSIFKRLWIKYFYSPLKTNTPFTELF